MYLSCPVFTVRGKAPDGTEEIVTHIIHPATGRWASEVGTEQGEYLASTTIGRLDRQLGIKSPFTSMPP
jgi:hypothetical protein